MAFEAFLSQDQAKPKKGRRVTYTASLAFHGALLVVGVIYSFWHVEELTPPTVTVTFMAAPPPPPPPPPPPKRHSSTKPKTQPQEIVQPKPDQVIQPKEEPKEEPEDDSGDDDGVEGGVEGGVKGGVVGGVVGSALTPAPPPPPPPPMAPKMLPPNIGKMQRLGGDEENPHLPEAFKRVDATYVVMAKICVNVQGSVATANIIKSADPLIDDTVLEKVRTWKFRPFVVNNNPVPFCYVTRFEFTTKQ